MATCGVCSAEQPIYRCPACSAQSCSLPCSQTHKSSCEPRPSEPGVDQSGTSSNAKDTTAESDTPNSHATPSLHKGAESSVNGIDLSALGSSSELQALFTRYPRLRSKLRDIYRSTLEEEWGDSGPQTNARRRGWGRGRGRGWHAGGRGNDSRSHWTAEKGFNRGLGRVRNLRNHCDESGRVDAEGFSEFVNLVTADRQPQEPSWAAET